MAAEGGKSVGGTASKWYHGAADKVSDFRKGKEEEREAEGKKGEEVKAGGANEAEK